jgi:hypothetical protein
MGPSNGSMDRKSVTSLLYSFFFLVFLFFCTLIIIINKLKSQLGLCLPLLFGQKMVYWVQYSAMATLYIIYTFLFFFPID